MRRCCLSVVLIFFFFNDTATTEIYTLSLHDALPISLAPRAPWRLGHQLKRPSVDRSEEHTSELQSHSFISYAVFCLKKKNNINHTPLPTPALSTDKLHTIHICS